MRAVMPTLLPDIMAQRKRTGADKWDEMWDGVLHMAPMPNRAHQSFSWALETYLRTRWAPHRKARVYHDVNLAAPGGWPDNYRIPDLIILSANSACIDHNEYFEGPPDAVVEIHSPGDEAYEKLAFYADLGVPEVWIIDRDTKQPEIYLLSGQYELVPCGADGWTRSALTELEMHATPGGKLAIRPAGNASKQEELPED